MLPLSAMAMRVWIWLSFTENQKLSLKTNLVLTIVKGNSNLARYLFTLVDARRSGV
jgi:hypothetical protein